MSQKTSKPETTCGVSSSASTGGADERTSDHLERVCRELLGRLDPTAPRLTSGCWASAGSTVRPDGLFDSASWIAYFEEDPRSGLDAQNTVPVKSSIAGFSQSDGRVHGWIVLWSDELERHLHDGWSRNATSLVCGTCGTASGPAVGSHPIYDQLTTHLVADGVRDQVSNPHRADNHASSSGLVAGTSSATPARHVESKKNSHRDRLRELRAQGELHELRRVRAAVDASTDGMTQREIARLLGTSQAAVHRLLRKARQDGGTVRVSPREVVLAYVAGHINDANLMSQLSDLDRGRHADGHDDGFVRGSWEEVRDAYLDDLLDDATYENLRETVREPGTVHQPVVEPAGPEKASSAGKRPS